MYVCNWSSGNVFIIVKDWLKLDLKAPDFLAALFRTGCANLSQSHKYLVTINFFFKNYESTNCSLKITNFMFSAQAKKHLDKVPFYEHLGKITYSIWVTIVKIRIGTHTEYFRTCSVL